MRAPTPIASQTSMTSRWCTMAREPTTSRAGRASSSTTGTPQRASSSAAVCPTGPAPTTMTTASALHGRPDLAVPFGGPDPRPVDAVQLVPQPLHVERQAVFEDRPAAERRRQRPVHGAERLLR